MPAGQAEHRRDKGDALGWSVAAAYGQLLADITIGGADGTLHHKAVVATGSLRLPPGVTVSLSLGAILEGSLQTRRRVFDLEPGFMMSAMATWRAVENDGGIPFVDVSAAAGFAMTKTTRNGHPTESLTALDVRAGGTVGWTLGGVFSPHVAVRLFGGPIFWRYEDEDVAGTDRWHFQLATGASLALPESFSVFFDWSFLGERSLWAGAGYSW